MQLRAARELSGKTQAQVAKETGISKSAVQRQTASAEEKLRILLSEGQKGE